MVRATFVAGSSPGFTRPVAFTGAATFTPNSKSKVSGLILRWWAKTALLGFTPCSDTFDFELGVKVAAPVKATGRVKPGELPATKVARTIYSGPYEGLPSAWGEFDAWMKANNHEKAESLWELYSVGPQSTPDPANWRTELNRPLKT